MPRRNTSTKKRVVAISPKRPIDKQLISINNTWPTAQSDLAMYTATFPCTVTGLRWEIVLGSNAGAPVSIKWVIARTKDGLAAGTIGTNPFFTPEVEVMAAGVATVAAGQNMTMADSTKTMRKLQNGDKLHFSYIATATNIVGSVLIQFFVKS